MTNELLINLKLRYQSLKDGLKNAVKEVKTTSEEMKQEMAKSQTGNTSGGSQIKNFLKKSAEAFKTFKKDMDASPTLAGMAKGALNFGGTMTGAWMKIMPWQMKVTAGLFAMQKILKAVCKDALELEKITKRAETQFGTGGAMQGVSADKYRRVAQKQMDGDGMFHESDILQGIGTIRGKYHSISEKTLDSAIPTIKNMAVANGEDFNTTADKYGAVLDSLSVSFEQLRDIGVAMTAGEIRHLNALKASGRAKDQETAAALIKAKADEVYAKSVEEASVTTTGAIEKSGTIWKKIATDMGEFLKPFLHFLTDVVNAISVVVSWITEILGYIGKALEKFYTSILRWLNFGRWNKYQSPKMPKKPTFSYRDPRVTYKAQFEGLDALNKRIQTSALSRYLPKDEKTTLLQSINTELKKMNETSQANLGLTKEEKKVVETLTKSITTFNVGAV